MDESPPVVAPAGSGPGLTIGAVQRLIRDLYGAKDAARGDAATFLWLVEEVGELATALRSGTDDELALEMADVLAWLVTLANVRGIDLEAAVRRKYGRACPGCGKVPCGCDPAVKP
jgi:NTP pyrophosphatase (non-canonical NTP hydrolase)